MSVPVPVISIFCKPLCFCVSVKLRGTKSLRSDEEGTTGVITIYKDKAIRGAFHNPTQLADSSPANFGEARNNFLWFSLLSVPKILPTLLI